MQRFNREPFVPEAQYKAIKPFVMSGVAYAPGQLVKTDAIETRRLRQMYESRIVEMVPVEKTAALLKPTAKPAKPQPPAPPVKPKRHAEHRGFGRWFVIEADGSEHGPFTKDVAEARAAG